MASSADLTAQSPLARMPKLKYRNPLPAEEDAPALQPPHESSSSHIQERPATADSIAAASTSTRPSFETASLTSSSLASTPSSAASSNDSKSSKKKKKASSVLGFLSLKEPSQVALEQFAEQQRKQTATKGTSTPTSRHSSTFVGKQLPSNVPKVNSKWDGVPAGAKRHSMSSVSNKDNKSSTSSRGSLSAQFKTGPFNDSKLSVMTDGTRNPPNSIASPATSMSNLTIGDQDPPYGSSPSTTTLPEMSYYFPDAPIMSGALPMKSFSSDGSYQPSAAPPPRPSVDTFDSSSTSEGHEGHRADSPASSTDSVDTVVRDTADALFNKLNDRPNQSLWGGEAPKVQPADELESDHVPDSHDFLFGPPSTGETSKNDSPMASPSVSHYVPPRPVQNFSRPIAANGFVAPTMHRPATYRSTPSSSALPTLYEASLASTDSLDTVQDNSDTRSIAPSSIAPSELSGHWYESPRERLGLGGRIRKNDILPWDDQGNSLGKPKKNRLSMFGIGTARV
ncbi:hypothetical protein N0V83_003879 [Neocucurbitaria cava]|uniref:Uncharacterized protein n=1 Tax=Neocucurbitaria cava TaxID=798079 RepID=A0A9W8YCM8_9PLEO|nr:hypothetical protein N0V83_003879 [Neocucurbitaria cava]